MRIGFVRISDLALTERALLLRCSRDQHLVVDESQGGSLSSQGAPHDSTSDDEEETGSNEIATKTFLDNCET